VVSPEPEQNWSCAAGSDESCCRWREQVSKGLTRAAGRGKQSTQHLGILLFLVRFAHTPLACFARACIF